MSERILKVILILLALLVAAIWVIPFTAEAQTHIHRSIQNNTSAIWTSGGTITFTITGDTIATFSSDAPDSIGRGVAIEYDSTGSSSIKAICFIKYRISKRQFGVQRFQGGNPSPASATTTWNMFHAYATYEKLHNGDENDGINNTVENFDAHTDGVNIDARSEYWNVAFYAGSNDITGTQGGDDMNTSATERLKLYAPCGTKYVGTSQRHSGILTFTKAVLTSTGAGFITNDDAGTRVCQHTDFEGLQFSLTGTGSTYAIQFNNSAAEKMEATITDCVFSGSDSVSTNASVHCAVIWQTGTAATSSYLYIKNSLFYGWKTAGATTQEGGVLFTSVNVGGILLVNNCTFYKCEVGVKRSNAGNTLTIKNCIFQRSADGVNGGVGGDKNVVAGTGDCAACTNEIVGTVAFTSQSGGDFSLHSTDTVAKDAGADLSGDTLPVTTDGKGYTRSGTYDCGFLEFGAAASGCSTELDATSSPTLLRRRNPVQ